MGVTMTKVPPNGRLKNNDARELRTDAINNNFCDDLVGNTPVRFGIPAKPMKNYLDNVTVVG